MFEQQWDEAGEHPSHDVLSMTRGRPRHRQGLLSAKSRERAASGLGISQPVLARCLNVAPEFAVSHGEPGTHSRYRRARGTVLVLDGFIVVLDLVGLVVDDRQDLDEAEGGSQASQGRRLVGIELGHSPRRLPPRWLVASGPKVQVDRSGLELELVDLALAVLPTFLWRPARVEGADLWGQRQLPFEAANAVYRVVDLYQRRYRLLG
jgi:hypothetical protein